MVELKPRPGFTHLAWLRLADRVALKLEPHENGCWLWTGTKNGYGYGRFQFRHHIVTVHRFVYEVCVGPLPERSLVLHECDSPPCCRPDHLMLGTELTNNQDCVAKGRHPELRFTVDQVKEIRRRAALGGRGIQPKLAKEFGVSLITIASILSHRTYAHVGDDYWQSTEWAVFVRQWQERMADELRLYRSVHGISQQELAKLLGVSNSYVNRLESGKRQACPSVIAAFCKLMGVQIGDSCVATR